MALSPTTSTGQAAPPLPPGVSQLRAIFDSDPTRGRDPTGAWDKAWKASCTPWDNAAIQPALRELVEEKWDKVPGVPWDSLIGGNALVAGCGRGYDAIYFASKGLTTLGIDLSPTAVEAAKANLAAESDPPKNVDFQALDFFEFKPSDGLYDLAYDYTFFCALPPEFRESWGKRYAQLVKPGGCLVNLMWPLGDRPGGPPFALTPKLYDEVLGDNFESATNKSTGDSSNSTASFISALITGLIVLTVLLAVWFALHKKDRLIFQPRTILPPKELRATELPDGAVAWFKTVFAAEDKLVLRAQGPDAYFFIRFIKLGIKIFAAFFVLTWLILMPIAGTGAGGLVGLNRFTFGNVSPAQQTRIVAYFLVAIILTLWVLFLLEQEYKEYRAIRQHWLADQGRQGPETRTVVILNVPKASMTPEGISELAADYGHVQKVWLGRIAKKMEDTYDERDKEVGILEKSEGKVLALAAKNKKKNKLPEQNAGSVEASDLISQYIAKKKQPTHKRGFLGLFGKKVDTLHESPEYITTKERELKAHREGLESLPLGDTAFVRFGSRQEAHAFASSFSAKNPIKSVKKIKAEIEVMPEDVVWENLKMNAATRTSKGILSWALTIFLIIIWAIPVAFVGFVSNINTLTSTVKFLSFLNGLPPAVIGIIQGILPPVLLAVLFMLLPIVLRKFVKMNGTVLKSDVERQLFVRFWLFQIIHGFLIVTLASGLIAALKDVKNTLPQLPTLLATKLPTASTFFLQWLALYALTSFGVTVSRVVPFIMDKLAFVLSGPTPRKTFGFQNKMLVIALGTAWPPVALLLAVGIAYSCIQPVITLFGLFTFCVLYIMYKYVMIWVADQPTSLETGGEMYRKALVTVFVSLYIELICLCGLFFLSTNAAGNRSKPGLAGGALMVVLIVLVAVFHWHSTHKRYPARDCHFLNGSLGKHGEGRTPMVGNLSDEHRTLHADEQHSSYPPGVKEGQDAGPEHGNTSGYHEHAFHHPATWKAAPVVWIADDTLGIGRSEAARLNDLDVPASTEYATMDADSKIDVHRGPPDEAWLGGVSKV